MIDTYVKCFFEFVALAIDQLLHGAVSYCLYENDFDLGV